jgi:hypothetical protein
VHRRRAGRRQHGSLAPGAVQFTGRVSANDRDELYGAASAYPVRLPKLDFEVDREFSFPFPRFMGRIFVYNEFVSLSTRASKAVSTAEDSQRRRLLVSGKGRGEAVAAAPGSHGASVEPQLILPVTPQ